RRPVGALRETGDAGRVAGSEDDRGPSGGPAGDPLSGVCRRVHPDQRAIVGRSMNDPCGPRATVTVTSPDAGVRTKLSLPAPAIEIRIRWPAGNRIDVGMSWNWSVATCPGTS